MTACIDVSLAQNAETKYQTWKIMLATLNGQNTWLNDNFVSTKQLTLYCWLTLTRHQEWQKIRHFILTQYSDEKSTSGNDILVQHLVLTIYFDITDKLIEQNDITNRQLILTAWRRQNCSPFHELWVLCFSEFRDTFLTWITHRLWCVPLYQ